MSSRALVVVAVEAERQAVLRGAPAATVVVAGVGPVAAAIATTDALSTSTYDAVYSLGIAGAFDPAVHVLIGSTAVAADLGVETEGSGDGARSVGVLDLILSSHEAAAHLLDAAKAALPQGEVGPLLTVWTVTGTTGTAARLRAAYPDAIGEAMEGFGVGAAAARAGVPFLEVRTVSNVVGPRQRDAWDITGALSRLTDVAGALLA